jgi:hypothetical protein
MSSVINELNESRVLGMGYGNLKSIDVTAP